MNSVYSGNPNSLLTQTQRQSMIVKNKKNSFHFQSSPHSTQSLQPDGSNNRPVRPSGSPPEKATIKTVKFAGNPLKKIGDAIIDFLAEIWGFVWGTITVMVLLAGLSNHAEKTKNQSK